MNETKIYQIHFYAKTKEDLESQCNEFDVNKVWYGEGYYLIKNENDAVWWRTISVLTPKMRISELYNQIEEIDSEMILMNSYLEKSKNLMVYWDVGKNHHELQVHDADTVTKYHILGVKMTRYHQTVFDLMMSGF